MRTSRFLIAAGVAVALCALTVPSLGARQEVTTGWEYARLTPGLPSKPSAMKPLGYRACLAGEAEWTCREFESKDNQDEALRRALSTLGSEGWELVSAIDETETLSYPKGLTYLLKRHKN